MSLITHCGARQVTWDDLDQCSRIVSSGSPRAPAHETITLQKLIGGGYGIPVQAT